MQSGRIEELVAASRRAGLLSDPSKALERLDRALADTDDPGEKGRLLLARALAQQGAADMTPAAEDALSSVRHLLNAGDRTTAAFATACAAGMIQRTGDNATALDLAVDALVLLPDDALQEESSVRAANAMALLFVQISAFDLAVASSRRAVDGAMALPDHNNRSIVSFTLGYCVVEALRAAGPTEHTRDELLADLDRAIEWLSSQGAGAMERAVLGSGMRAERALMRHLDRDGDISCVSAPEDRAELMAALILLEQGASAYPNTAPRIAAWHRLVTASVLRHLGQTDRAEELLDAAIPELSATTEEHRIIRAFTERSIARTMNGDLMGALDDMRQVAELTRSWQQRQGARLGNQIAHRADLEQARSQLRRRADDLAKQASEDAVTGLASRRWLEMQLDEAARMPGRGAVVVLDLDRFKAVNDTFGHQTGDVVLREVGEVIGSVVRADTPVARFGGEEFVVLLPGVDADTGIALAERVRAAIEAHDWEAIATGLKVTTSAGVAEGPLVGIRELLRLADTALYDAKRAGRNRVIAL